MRYREYIRSDEWQVKRLTRIKRDGKRKCFMCHGSGPTDVHHKTYARLGREHLSDLVQLCRSCHDIVHDYFVIGNGRGNTGYHKLSKAWVSHANREQLWGLRKRQPDKFTRLADQFFRARLEGRAAPTGETNGGGLSPFQQQAIHKARQGRAFPLLGHTPAQLEELNALVAAGKLHILSGAFVL